jgi:hypothetical protein
VAATIFGGLAAVVAMLLVAAITSQSIKRVVDAVRSGHPLSMVVRP